MSRTSWNMIIGSSVVAVLVLFAILIDLMTGMPFRREPTLDISFSIGALLILFMAYDTWRDLS